MIYPFIYSAERDISQATSPFLLKDHLVSMTPQKLMLHQVVSGDSLELKHVQEIDLWAGIYTM